LGKYLPESIAVFLGQRCDGLVQCDSCLMGGERLFENNALAEPVDVACCGLFLK
jgi:hypothetical protein